MAVQPERPGDALQSSPPREPLGRLWAFLASPLCAAILLSLAALLIALSAVFPQSSPIVSDPAARERWLAETSARWGALGPTLRALDLFQVRDSLLWKICLGLGALAMLVRLEVSARRAWDFTRGDLSGAEFLFQEEAAAAGPRGQALGAISRALENRGFSVRAADDADLSHLHAVRQPRAAWLQTLCCAGVLLLLVSLLASGAAAQWERVALAPGASEPLSLRAGWSALLRVFTAEPGGARGQVAVFGPEANLLADGAVAVERPLWARGITLHLSGAGPGLLAEAIGAAGQAMMLQPASGAAQSSSLFLLFDEDQPEQYFAVPETEDTVRVVLHPGSGNGAQEFLIQVYRGSEVEPRAESLLSEGASLAVDGATYRFTAAQYPILIAASDSAKWLLWAGAALTILAALLMQFFTPRALLVRAAGRNGATALQFLAEEPEVIEMARAGLQAAAAGETP